jgi:hypothetical protein
VELEVAVGSARTGRAVATDVASQFQLQIAVLVGAVLQNLRDVAAQSPPGYGGQDAPYTDGGGPRLALAPEFLLEAPELRFGQFGQPTDDHLYLLPPASVVYADTIIRRAGTGCRDPPPLNSLHGDG